MSICPKVCGHLLIGIKALSLRFQAFHLIVARGSRDAFSHSSVSVSQFVHVERIIK